MKKVFLIISAIFANSLFSQQASYDMMGQTPITMTSLGSGTYNMTVFYHNLEKGLTIDLAKATDNITATPIDFNINARGGLNEFFTIKGNTGNTGIGTNTPTEKLDVLGNIRIGSTHSTEGINALSIRYQNGSLNNWGSLRSSSATFMSFGVKADNTVSDGWLSSDASLNSRLAMTIGNGGFSFLSANQQSTAINSPVTMTEVMKITTAGNAALQGKFEAKEIKVTLTPTADFVFENDYNLPKLEDVEKHIKEKKHLPEIASAKEMEKEGVNVGEFQIKLLQKIEELTLYTIEQNKLIKEQQRRIEALENNNK